MTIIRVKNLGKKYTILREGQSPYASIKENISNGIKRFANRLNPFSRRSKQQSTSEEFWAIQDVNLTVEAGDKLAILGRNGAGKSTLLKLLSRVTLPTKGRIEIKGRLSSLLEVGGGFHPELSGRENIFVNGATLGMSYREMKKNLDSIIEFSGVEKFLDTPVKRYSSGMFMRLGFAIAAHLESDILIVDEALAVGDAAFQEKCLKKMNEIGDQGKTILFVSHHINSVLSICNKGILLEQGMVKYQGDIQDCVAEYVRGRSILDVEWNGPLGNEDMIFHKVRLQPPKTTRNYYYSNESTVLDVDFEVLKTMKGSSLGLIVVNDRGLVVAQSTLGERGRLLLGEQKVSFHLDLSLFHPGEYSVIVNSFSKNHERALKDEISLKLSIVDKEASTNQFSLNYSGLSLGNRWSFE